MTRRKLGTQARPHPMHPAELGQFLDLGEVVLDDLVRSFEWEHGRGSGLMEKRAFVTILWEGGNALAD
ncbi:MAG: hypothetical protein OXF54_16635 [Caldilineaceae bacterium]|nr:hypothetical protein [Caldilineaceae bacterium]